MEPGDTTTLTGASGDQYAFAVLPRTTTFQAKPGVYVMGRQSVGRRYHFCYVGETADLSKRPLAPDKQPCIKQFGANAIFLLEELDASRRSRIVDDLVRAYMPSCNAP
jgi:hypothetical protein